MARALVAKELAQSVDVVLHDQVDFNQQFKGDAAHAAKASTVAPEGKPLGLTELGNEFQRVIGKPVGHAEVRIWDGVE